MAGIDGFWKRLVVLFFASTVAYGIAGSKDSLVVLSDNIPAVPEHIIDRMHQYQNTRSVFIQDWDPRGNGLFITTRFSQTYQVHYIEKPAGMRKQITFFDEPVYYAYPCPDSAMHGFLYETDKGGNEFTQIYYYDLDKSSTTLLTDGISKNDNTLWSHKGDRFIYTSTQRNGSDFDLYMQDIHLPKRVKTVALVQGDWVPLDWSFDDTRLLVMRFVSANESNVYILDVATGALTPLLSDTSIEKVTYTTALWTHDNKGVYFISDQAGEFLSLRYYDIGSNKSTVLTSEIHWNIMELFMSPAGDKIAFTTNEHGLGSLYLLEVKTGKYRKLPGIPPGRVFNLRFDPSGQKLAFVVSSAQVPQDAFVYDLKKNSVQQWTFSEVGGLHTGKFVLPTIQAVPTFDSVNQKPRTIPVFYYIPAQCTTPVAVMIKIHGGPESQHWPTFDPIVQYYTNELGIAVVAPNVRGSAGYGKTYLTLDNGFKREDALRDIGAVIAWIKKQPELDSMRIGVMGGSYGGYLSLASMVRYADQLSCGIDIFGISNFVTFLQNTQGYRRDLRKIEYGDERDSAMALFLERISPSNHAGKITKPLFIYQGANDPRVPQTESEQMVKAIRKNKGMVWYMLAKDEGHGFGKKQDQDLFEATCVLFLEKYLLKK